MFSLCDVGPAGRMHPGTEQAPNSRHRRREFGTKALRTRWGLGRDRRYGHVRVRKGRTEFLAFCRYLRSLHPPDVRIAIVLDNFSPHLSTWKDQRVSEWAEANIVEFACLTRH